MVRYIASIGLLLTLFGSVGCQSVRYSFQGDARRNFTLVQDTSGYFDYKNSFAVPQEDQDRSSQSPQLKSSFLYIPSIRVENCDLCQSIARYFEVQPSKPGVRNKLVIVLSIYGSDHTYPQEVIARTLRERDDRDT